MTINDVRDELKIFRYYYQRKSEFDRMKNVVVAPEVMHIVNKYLNLAGTCEPKLYLIFCGLYIDGYSQEALAEKWGYSVVYIRKLNKKLCEYFVSKLA